MAAVLLPRRWDGVRQADGLVAGYWSAAIEAGDAHSLIVFNSRHDRESHGVEGDDVVVVELMAHA